MEQDFNLNQSNVSLDDPVFNKMLNNLQANILKGHGRDFAYHVFLSLIPEQSELAKNWIINFTNSSVTSARKHLEGTRSFRQGKTTDAGPIISLSISASGYDNLKIGTKKPGDSFFRDGMKLHGLGDDHSIWDEGFNQNVDILIIIADDSADNADRIAQQIIDETSLFATLKAKQRGNVLKMEDDTGIEHFGYADGISQPIYLADEINAQQSNLEWHDKKNLNFLLVPDQADSTHSFGSYLVFRKLDQNVSGFKDAEALLPKIKDVDGDENDELAGALLVGRFENGVTTAKSSIDFKSNPPQNGNDLIMQMIVQV